MTPWRLAIRHHTEYQYGGEVGASYNEARMTPPDTAHQLVLDHRIEVQPGAHLGQYRDYWGTWVHAFDLHQPHRSLRVTSHSTVETGLRRGDGPAATSWAELVAPEVLDRWCEYLDPTAYTEPDDEVRALAADWRTLPTPGAAVEAAVAWVHTQMAYETGSTTVHTTASESMRQRRGVCQDFSHLTLALLRAMGIPARYTSGYFHPAVAEAGTTVEGESHAWIEARLGEWVAYDPTSGVPVAERHVVVAHGRDYADVPPLKGIYHGAAAAEVTVNVELTRVA
jgi:transglutaminase-like putative cysteine protease